MPPLFSFLVQAGSVSEAERYRVFNMGIGMVLVIDPKKLSRVEAALEQDGRGVFPDRPGDREQGRGEGAHPMTAPGGRVRGANEKNYRGFSPFFVLACAGLPLPAGETLTLASTTSTLDSGLFDALIPPFEKKFACTVKVIAVGTGQAMRLARDGNADVLLVHDREAEEKFVADGFGVERLDVMHNDFVVVGPGNDPAGARGLQAAEAFARIAAAGAFFASRGDDSGTHKKELQLWQAAGIRPSGALVPGERQRHGGDPAHRQRKSRLLPGRPRHLAGPPEGDRRPGRGPERGRRAAVQPLFGDRRLPGKVLLAERQAGPQLRRLHPFARGPGHHPRFRQGADSARPSFSPMSCAEGHLAHEPIILDGLRQGRRCCCLPGARSCRSSPCRWPSRGRRRVLASLAAIPAALFLALKEFRGKRLVVGLVNTAMAVPAVLIGLLVYGLVSRRGPLGSLGLLFTPGAMVLAQALLAFPADHAPWPWRR